MADLAKARELAIKLGYLDENGRVGPGGGWAAYAQPTAYGQPVYARAIGIPRTIMERPPAQYLGGGTAIEISRFALNPGEAFYRQLLPGASFAYAAPRMFATGDLPIITASGVDPTVLAWCAWYYRHSAAMTDSRAHFLEIIEQSQSQDYRLDPEALQIESGRDAWQNYFAQISQWVSTPPGQQPTGTQAIEQQMLQLYGPGGGEPVTQRRKNQG